MKALALGLLPINLLIVMASVTAIKVLDAPSVSISAALAGNTALVNDTLVLCWVLVGTAVIAIVALLGLLIRSAVSPATTQIPGTNHLWAK
jgi:magnesium-transporting ATPase (P-type)